MTRIDIRCHSYLTVYVYLITVCCVSQVLGWHRCGLHLVDHKSSNNCVAPGECRAFSSGSYWEFIRTLNLEWFLYFDAPAAPLETYLVSALAGTITSPGTFYSLNLGNSSHYVLCYLSFYDWEKSNFWFNFFIFRHFHYINSLFTVSGEHKCLCTIIKKQGFSITVYSTL